jgi:hypothetical protein
VLNCEAVRSALSERLRRIPSEFVENACVEVCSGVKLAQASQSSSIRIVKDVLGTVPGFVLLL